MRTPEQITAQLEARYAELEAEAQNPKRLYPCKTCRWAQRGSNMPWCYEPLSRGFKEHVQAVDGWSFGNPLCGPEKALWQPRPTPRTRIQRLIDWLASFWGNDNG